MRIAVCDDEKIFADMLCKEIDGFYKSYDVICERFYDGSAIISAFEKGMHFDTVFLDIEMNNVDGMTAAEKIRKYSPKVHIIFLTSHTEFALKGYEVGAFRFLRKPIEKEKLAEALRDTEKNYYSKNTVVIKEKGSEFFIYPEEIISVQSDNNDVRIITPDKEYRTRMKISKALDMLKESSPYFFRIHRCIVVNLRHVSGYRDNEVTTDNGDILPMSKKISEDFKNEIHWYIRENAV